MYVDPHVPHRKSHERRTRVIGEHGPERRGIDLLLNRDLVDPRVGANRLGDRLVDADE